MDWHCAEHDGVKVVHLSGYLGRLDVHRFDGAMDWVRSRTDGPVVLDLTALLGWSREGEAAVVRAAETPLAVCGLRGRPAPALTGAAGRIRIYPDPAAAVAAMAAPDPAAARGAPATVDKVDN
jgi:hypothetical protein